MKIALALLLLLAVPAAGADLAGNDLMIPIAGRAAGQFGSQWHTDVVLTSAVENATANVVVRFHPSDGSAAVETQVELRPSATVVLEDFVRRDNVLGQIRLTSLSEKARFTARAYVYNRGSASGEFGQNVPGVPVDSLTNQHVIAGITGTNGRRTNVGIANPWNRYLTGIYISLYDADGDFVASGFRDVPARSVKQFDPFAELGVAPLAAASLRISGGGAGVYAYASITRSDSGDPIFLPSTGIASLGSAAVTPPVCFDPAPLVLAPTSSATNRWIIQFRDGFESDEMTPLLASRYGFTVIHKYSSALEGFAAELTPQQVASLRCEESVSTVAQDADVQIVSGQDDVS